MAWVRHFQGVKQVRRNFKRNDRRSRIVRFDGQSLFIDTATFFGFVDKGDFAFPARGNVIGRSQMTIGRSPALDILDDQNGIAFIGKCKRMFKIVA